MGRGVKRGVPAMAAGGGKPVAESCRIATSPRRRQIGGRKDSADLLYDAYELHRSLLNSASNWAAIGAKLFSNPALPMGYFGTGPIIASALQVFAHLYEERGKPEFGIRQVTVDGREYAVEETVVLEKPFGALRHFRREGLPADAPRLLIVAPMSGHYATLLRGTVARMVHHQDVWITDWADAKMVPL